MASISTTSNNISMIIGTVSGKGIVFGSILPNEQWGWSPTPDIFVTPSMWPQTVEQLKNTKFKGQPVTDVKLVKVTSLGFNEV